MAGSITINSNIFALATERWLSKSTASLKQSFERLSSGMRINHASDDAAGLALASKLQADSQVYAQAIRNVNDGISLLNITEGALNELSNITIRHHELSTQAANGTLSRSQRQAIHDEANALVDEYNRIVSVTKFNQRALLDRSLGTMTIQAGGGTGDGISFVLGEQLARTAGTGSFTAGSTVDSLHPENVVTADVDNNGTMDVLVAEPWNGAIGLLRGNGDGTFRTKEYYSTVDAPNDIIVADLNGDGNLDLAASSYDQTVRILFGNSGGTFKSSVSYAAGANPLGLAAGDFDNDGDTDLAVGLHTEGAFIVYKSNGNGTFASGVSYRSPNEIHFMQSSDFNNDGFDDLAVGECYNNTLGIYFANSDGSFKSPVSYAGSSTTVGLSKGDLNGDGIIDLVTSNYDSANLGVYLGNSNGTFKAQTILSTGANPFESSIEDFNSDGYLDIAVTERTPGTLGIFLGRGDGTFGARTSVSVGARTGFVTAGDFNGDGVADLVSSQYEANTVAFTFANTTKLTTIAHMNLNSQEDALDAMQTVSGTLDRITSELGLVGAMQSRFSSAVNVLAVTRENYMAARSQIVDADIAAETAELVKHKILQQAGAAILAQAAQIPALALKLLET
jgi:flagellin-like hook-associated protein FlgL